MLASPIVRSAYLGSEGRYGGAECWVRLLPPALHPVGRSDA